MKQLFALTILIACAGAAASAKGTTTRISIAGPALGERIDITDARVIQRFDVWSGPGTAQNGVAATQGFIADWSAPIVHERQTGTQTYEISFFVKFRDEGAEQLAYVVDYDEGRSEGFVFIPGSGDPRFRQNVRSILRGVEGQWFRATPEWRAFVSRELAAKAPRRD